jgi:hypothetical protein
MTAFWAARTLLTELDMSTLLVAALAGAEDVLNRRTLPFEAGTPPTSRRSAYVPERIAWLLATYVPFPSSLAKYVTAPLSSGRVTCSLHQQMSVTAVNAQRATASPLIAPSLGNRPLHRQQHFRCMQNIGSRCHGHGHVKSMAREGHTAQGLHLPTICC